MMKTTTPHPRALDQRIRAIGCLIVAAASLKATASDWSFDVSPYLWVASVDVETSLPSTPSGVDRFETRISGGAMLAAQARYRSVGLFVDFAWLRLDTEAINPGPAFSVADLQSDFIHTTVALTYSLPLRGKFHVDVLAGGRLWYVSEDLEAQGGVLPGFNASADKTWVDPIIGADLRYELSKRWSLVAKGTVGGFGVSSDIAWEVFSGASYRFNDCCSLTFGYRYLHEEYSHSGLALDLGAHGFLLGVGFHF
jgi:opacity protein-like surface antigen